MQKPKKEALLSCVKKQPQTIQQLLSNSLWETIQPLSRPYAQKCLKELGDEGVIKRLQIEGVLYYMLNPDVKKLADNSNINNEWSKLLAVAQPIVREWHPYVPPVDTPHRKGADDHLQWKSLGTP